METIIKEFVCTTKVQESETTTNFKAVIKCSCDSPYRIKVTTQKYEQGKIKIHSVVEMYFDKKGDMLKEFEYNYSLCKGNYFTNSIKIIK